MKRTVLEEMSVHVESEYRLGMFDVGMPEVKQKSMKIEASGGDYEVSLPQREAMMISLRSANVEPDVIKDLGLCGVQKTITIRTIEKDVVGSCDKEYNEITATGQFLSWSPGDIKQGADNKREYKFSVKKLEWKQNGVVIFNHDVFGVSEENRAALGLN